MDSFAAALADAGVRVECGPSDRPPAAPPVQALLNSLLELVPERRSTVAELCDGRAEDGARAPRRAVRFATRRDGGGEGRRGDLSGPPRRGDPSEPRRALRDVARPGNSSFIT